MRIKQPECHLIFASFERTHRLVILPAFFSGSVELRLLICLFLHPIVLEAAEALGRSSSGEAVALQLRNGELTTENSEARVVQKALGSFGIKMLMAFFRRFMASVTMSPYALVSIQECN